MSKETEFYCCDCNHRYEETPGDKASNDLKHYCKFLGYCGEKCFNKLTDSEQFELCHYAYLNGDKIKRNHKWYMTNIPNYK